MAYSTLDIVLPCYNPQPGWEEKIITVFKELCTRLPDIQLSLILVNDGSEKNITEKETDRIKKSIHYFQYISYPENKGKGFALREGVRHTQADIVIYTDIDFPYTTDSILRIWQPLAAGDTDIAAGVSDASYYAAAPYRRKLISKMLRFLSTVFLRLKISDTQRGLKGFNTRGKVLFLQTTINRYLFDLEFIYLASKKKHHLSLRAVPVELKEGVVFSKMKPATLAAEGLNFLKLFFRSILGGR